VIIGGAVLAFTEVSGLAVQHEEVVYRDGMSFLLDYSITRGFAKPINLTLRSGMVVKGEQGTDKALKSLNEAFKNLDKQDIDIHLCDAEGVALIRWKVIGAVPMKIDYPNMSADSNDVAIQTLEFTARKLIQE